jgi:glycosyltransferase involved in cell wall biosynthesis
MTSTHLVLFMTRGSSLRRWEIDGVFERETALHLRLREQLAGISIVTYGGDDELDFQARLPGFQILYNKTKLPAALYSLMAPLLHHKELRNATIFRSNQIDGAWTAVIAGLLYHKPVIVRAGYLWSEFVERLPLRVWKKRIVRWLQRFVLQRATMVVVTTQEMQQQVTSAYGVRAQRVSVIPNYVDTKRFHPIAGVEKIPGRICFVGRLEPQKNLYALIEAVAAVPGAFLVCFGDGRQREGLAARADELNVRVEFRGRVSNEQLPLEINRSEIFILPSFYEGHPKALLEAMACGAAVIGTRVTGIQEVIDDGVTGLLCETSASDIARALNQLLGDSVLRQKVGAAASVFAAQEYSLDSVVEKETALLHRIFAAETDA